MSIASAEQNYLAFNTGNKDNPLMVSKFIEEGCNNNMGIIIELFQ